MSLTSTTSTVGSTNLAKTFVDEALKHVGEGASWTWATYGQANIEWCAAFISAVAKTVGILNKCIYNTAGAGIFAREGIKLKYGTFNKGPGQGGSYLPTQGDLIMFRWSSTGWSDQYGCAHVGIVVSADASKDEVITVEGNTGTNNKNTSKVKKKSYSLKATSISGYFHPDWSLVGSVDPAKLSVSSQLYTSATTREDMTVREIGYLDKQYQPSIKSSNIKLSVINYTGLLATVFKLVAPSTIISSTNSNVGANTDKLTGNCKIVVNYLMSKGLNAAAACGIAGNIYHESSFKTDAIGDYGTSFGICQWHNERGTAMKRMAGSNWASNLTGQLDYLWYELTTSYNQDTLIPLQGVTNNVTGCKTAADIFVRRFERPADPEGQTILRQATALSYFNQVIVLNT